MSCDVGEVTERLENEHSSYFNGGLFFVCCDIEHCQVQLTYLYDRLVLQLRSRPSPSNKYKRNRSQFQIKY